MFEILAKLKAVRDIIGNPAIPDTLERAGQFLIEAGAFIRNLQGSPIAFDGPGLDAQVQEFAAITREIEARQVFSTAASEPSNLDPATILLIVQVAKQLLDLLRKRRQS